MAQEVHVNLEWYLQALRASLPMMMPAKSVPEGALPGHRAARPSAAMMRGSLFTHDTIGCNTSSFRHCRSPSLTPQTSSHATSQPCFGNLTKRNLTPLQQEKKGNLALNPQDYTGFLWVDHMASVCKSNGQYALRGGVCMPCLLAHSPPRLCTDTGTKNQSHCCMVVLPEGCE